MANLTSVLPEIQLLVPEAPRVLLLDYLRFAAITFCERSTFWRADISMNTVADQASYDETDFTVPTDSVLSCVYDGTYDGSTKLRVMTPGQVDRTMGTDWESESGTPYYVLRTDAANTIQLAPYPTAVKAVVLPAAWKPTLTATTIADDVYNEYHEALAWGAVAGLCGMPRKAWSDPNYAKMYADLYNSAIEEAKRRVENAYAKPKRQMSYGGI